MTALAKLDAMKRIAAFVAVREKMRGTDPEVITESNGVSLLISDLRAALSPAELGGVEVDNPWREFIENVINGDNFFRASEYRSLLSDLDRLYALEQGLSTPRAAEAEWLPIESAPKDGRLFLCWVDAIRYCESEDGQQVSVDVSDFDFGRWCDSEHGGYYENMMGNIGDGQNITHWRALTPPSAKGE